ncbi:hypothetical protein BRC83_08885 [Halobacteriales archaeon QS_1_68_17]|nr:MAG: hypothetical protein BRC83_08885 [Halobacteriales archaeon QS_1_68_17]
MSDQERKVADVAGDVCYAVRDGEPVGEPRWRSCRLVLTDRRLIVAGDGNRQAIPHGKVTVPADRESVVPEGVDATGAVVLSVGNSVLLAAGGDDFERIYYRTNVGGEVVLAKHPAVVGGVVKDAEWRKARFTVSTDAFQLTYPGGEGTVDCELDDVGTVDCELDDVGTVETSEQAVTGQQRTVVAVEHTDDDGRSVETYLSGTERHASVLRALFVSVIDERDDSAQLDELESQVLMALYSGVSPFEMADFVGVSVEEIEEVYQRLLEVGTVDEVRTRTEVELNAQGRNMASETINER